jgi:hypothetical protein
MLRLQALAMLLLVTSANAEAGCIGPVIDGKCHGREVQWDTGEQDYEQQGPVAPELHQDKRDTNIRRQHPAEIDPFGRDPQDSEWLEPQPHLGRFR